VTRLKETRRGPTIEFTVHATNGHKGRQRLKRGRPPAPEPVEAGRIPRVSRLLALAHKMDRLVRDGHVQSHADLAELGGVTRARLTQILSMLLLAPDLQEEILFLPRTISGRDVVTERQLRRITAEPEWETQRHLWVIDGGCQRVSDP